MKKLRLTPTMKKRLFAILLVLAVVGLTAFLANRGENVQPLMEYFPFLKEIFPQENVPAAAPAPPEGAALRVHILDVGQADCILVQGPEKTLVIDGGESGNAPGIVEYLRDQGVERIDYYLNTHPHSDHYGGISQVMQAIPTGEFFHHPPPEPYTPTTRSYQKLLQYLLDTKTKTTVLEPGDTLELGDGAVFTILAPLEEYEDMNNNSLVGRLTFGERAFLFTGDAEKKSEKAILESGAELSADVYSIPHHGSNTGVTQGFLDRVKPRYATISVGKDNDYGHPHRDTVQRLSDGKIPCLRTDVYGSIVFETDGKTLTVTTDKGEYKKAA